MRYYFPTEGNVDLFAEGGLAIIRTGGDAPSSTEFGLNLGGGASIPLSDNLVGTAMLVYGTEAEQIKIMGGVTFMMGN